MEKIIKAAPIAAPVEPGQVKLFGWLGKRLDNNIRTRVMNEDDFRTFLSYYQNPQDAAWSEEQGKWQCMWPGEHMGKWLTAACNSYHYTHDPKLAAQIDSVVTDLLKLQQTNGYLGSYPAGCRFWDADWSKIDTVGGSGTGHYDVWNYSLLMMGLMRHYETFGEERSLKAAQKMADCWLDTFGTGPGKRSILYTNASGPDVAAGSIRDSGSTCIIYPLAWLYRYIPDAKYMDGCKYIMSVYCSVPEAPVYRITNEKGDRSSEIIKGCEDFLNLLGLAELYETTGDAIYLTSLENIFDGFVEQNRVMDTLGVTLGYECDMHPFVIFCQRLFELTGQPKYLDALEYVVYNAASAKDHGTDNGICMWTDPYEGKKEFKIFEHVPGNCFCCYTMYEMGASFLHYPIYLKTEDGLVIGFYETSELKTSLHSTSVTVRQMTDYPFDGSIKISIEPESTVEFTLKLRIPTWCISVQATVNGTALDHNAQSGEFLTISRTWQPGDTVELHLAMPTRVKESKGDEFHTLHRGPLVLAYDKVMNPLLKSNEFTVCAAYDGNVDVKVLKYQQTVSGFAFQLNAKTEESEQPVAITAYAEAGNNGDGMYTTWFRIQENRK